MKAGAWLGKLHKRFRDEKVRLFFEELSPDPNGTMLDLGGGHGVTGEFAGLHRHFRETIVMNVTAAHLFEGIDGRPIAQRLVQGDATEIPLADESVDYVFSNAVLEHVGDREKQLRFAREVVRVARKGYFVATPNRTFPLDPHTLLPAYHYAPERLQRRLIKFSLGEMKEYEDLRLVSAGELREMFPRAEVRPLGLRPLRNNLVVFARL